METTHRRFILSSLMILSAFSGTSCSTAPKASTPTDAQAPQSASGPQYPFGSQVPGSTEPYGPPAPENVPAGPDADSAYGPVPSPVHPVVLVLGPGSARGFAHAGVLRAFHEAKIPIAAIIGVEAGALVGSLYAEGETINDFEWALHRFKDKTILANSGLFANFMNRPSEGKSLENALNQTLGAKDIAQAKIPLRVEIQNERTRDVTLADRGPSAQAVRASMAVDGVLTPAEFNGELSSSPAATRPYPVTDAQALFPGSPVIAVDVLSDPPASSREKKLDRIQKHIQDRMNQARSAGVADLKAASLVIRPDLRGIGFAEYSKRTEIEFRGKAAAETQMEAIRKLAGM